MKPTRGAILVMLGGLGLLGLAYWAFGGRARALGVPRFPTAVGPDAEMTLDQWLGLVAFAVYVCGAAFLCWAWRQQGRK